MKPSFLLQREIKNEFEYGRVHNPFFHVHFHSHIEIYIFHSGEVEVLINDRRQVLRAGEISVAFSYDSHGYRTVSDSQAEYLIIPRDYCKEVLPLLDQRQITSPFICDQKTYEIIADALRQLAQKPNDLTERGLIYLILGAILNHTKMYEDKDHPSPRFSPEILIYVSEHFREELTLPILAKRFGYNPSYLSRSFKENFGISFCKYITMLRLREAILLLKNGETNITKCALESGFGSTRSFYRAFHEEFGVTPKEYQSIGDDAF